MPMPRSWVEGLVVEYYVLRGFMVNFDIPIGTGAGGGRRDLDVVAVDTINIEVHIVDITNIWSGKADKIVSDVVGRLNEAVNVVSEWYGRGYHYIKKAVLLGESWRPKMRKIINDLKQSGIDACSLQDLILEIVKYADEWRSEMIKRGS